MKNEKFEAIRKEMLKIPIQEKLFLEANINKLFYRDDITDDDRIKCIENIMSILDKYNISFDIVDIFQYLEKKYS